MTGRIEREQFQSPINLVAIGLVVAILVLTPALFSLPQTQEKSKDNPDDFTRVYKFTYDDVFQAANEVLFRHGGNIKTADKDKGLLSSVSNAVNGPEDRCTTDVRSKQ